MDSNESGLGSDLKDLRELVEFLKANSIAEFGMIKGDLRLRLKFQGAGPAPASAPAVDMSQLARLMASAPAAPPAAAPPAPAPGPAAPAAAAEAAPAEKLHVLKSPIVGTFYDSPAPGSPPFVKVGDSVEAGQIVCIIEAMKLMNEIEADVAGEIVERTIKVGQPVEYGQPLFSVRPR